MHTPEATAARPRLALWQLAFRPFFLAGALLAILAVALWLLAFTGQLTSWQPAGGWLGWHRHEMLFGFAMAIIAGFLLSAVQTWTGRPSVSGKALWLLSGLWLAGRLAWLANAPLYLLAPLELAFPLLVTAHMARLLWAVRQQRNYPVVLVLALLSSSDALMLLGLATDNPTWQRQGSLAALWLVAGLIGLIGGRVIPFFTQRGLAKQTAVQAWAWLDNSLFAATLVLALAYASGCALQPQAPLGLLLLALTAGHCLRLVRWYDRGYWRIPLLWSLHLALLWHVLALLGFGLWHLQLLSDFSLPLHAQTIGCMSALILAMLARVSLGHTGRPLLLPNAIAGAFVLLNLSAALRVFITPLLPSLGLLLAGLAWCLAFAFYTWQYAPMLLSPRADGKPG